MLNGLDGILARINFAGELKDWISVNLSKAGFYARVNTVWDVLFGDVLWSIWFHRNKRIFDPDWSEVEPIMERSRILQGETQMAIESAMVFASLETARLLNQKRSVGVSFTLYDRVVSMLERDWIVHICHISKDANQVADKLSKMLVPGVIAAQTYHDPPLYSAVRPARLHGVEVIAD
ncbi:uncharacterized protein LOC120179463 [Hibiscus syriacus]|uniref:uncharacterized protein LOC120179463 n=1 Tax=Hibiscus syriacus TaxID=106335 RepID=UPI0019211A16|nr:uncharacterized protein LOC120179463 [Hibiscus syriacus]